LILLAVATVYPGDKCIIVEDKYCVNGSGGVLYVVVDSNGDMYRVPIGIVDRVCGRSNTLYERIVIGEFYVIHTHGIDNQFFGLWKDIRSATMIGD